MDTVTDGNNGIPSLSSGPTFAGNAASLAVGATLHQATFVINQPAVDSGSINIVMYRQKHHQEKISMQTIQIHRLWCKHNSHHHLLLAKVFLSQTMETG